MLLDVLPAFQKQDFLVLGVGGLTPTGILNLRCWCTAEGEFCRVNNASPTVRPNQISPPACCNPGISRPALEVKVFATEGSQGFKTCPACKNIFTFYRSSLRLCCCCPGPGRQQWQDRLQTVWPDDAILEAGFPSRHRPGVMRP